MTTTQSTETDLHTFLQTAEAQRIMEIGFRNIKELYVARETGCTRREARAALKITGRW